MPQIQATVHSFTELFASHKLLRVPLYQRPYSWDKDQWDQLWRDMTELDGDEPHFLGNVVLAPEPEEGNPRREDVVDGQQRLATLSILAVVLRNCFVMTGETELADRLHFDCLVRASFDSSRLPRLLLGEKERKWFADLVQAYKAGQEDMPEPAAPKRTDPRSLKLLVKCYRFFKKAVANADPKQLAGILSERLLFVVTTTQAEEDAYTLFECLNDRGLSLSVADLFKNHLLSRLKGRDKEEFEDSLEEWTMMERILDRDLGNYLRHYWLSTREKVTRRQLYRAMKRESISGKLDPRHFVAGLYDQMKDYRHLTEPPPVLEQQSSTRQREMWLLTELRTLQFRVIYSLLLAAWKRFREQPGARLEVLEAVDSYLVRYASFAGLVTNRLEGFFSGLARELREETGGVDPSKSAGEALGRLRQELEKDTPSPELVRAGFLDLEPSNKIAAALLVRIAYEVHREVREPTEVVALPLVDVAELRNGSRITGVEDPDGFREVAERLGNFVLLPKGEEKAFKDCRSIADRLRFLADSSMASKVNPPADGTRTWGAEQVHRRQEALWEHARGIWCPAADQQARLSEAAEGRRLLDA